MGEIVEQHLPCPDQSECGSSDAYAIYDDGWGHCFSCDKNFKEGEVAEGEAPKRSQSQDDKLKYLLRGDALYYTGIDARGIFEETCRKFRYQMIRAVPDLPIFRGDDKRPSRVGQPAHVAPYYRDGQLVAQKLRFKDKGFHLVGAGKGLPFFGQNLWTKGAMLVVTEGEIDALTVSQIQDNKWPVVSLPNGAPGYKDVERELEYFDGFTKVVFLFDGDKPGREGARKCAERLPVGKAFIAELPEGEDPNSLMLKGQVKTITDAIWNAKPYRPDGIVCGNELTLDELMEEPAIGFDLQYPGLDEKLHGLRKQELTLLTAGSGIGKSTLAREIAYDLHQRHGLTIGNIYLEERKKKTAQGYAAIHHNVPLGSLRQQPTLLTKEQWTDALDNVLRPRMHYYDHFGSLESERLVSKMRFMAVSLGVDFIVLDHISIVVSGQESSSEGERRDIDRLMTSLRSLVEETGIGLIAIVHLKQPEGKAHEEGGRVTLSHLRGSGALKQLSDNVIALERDQQSDEGSDLSTIRVLKNREFGETGEAGCVRYVRETGRLLPADNAPSGFDNEAHPSI